MAQHSVTIYSNGIADFVRSYPVTGGGETTISIPVKQHHIADVLASFNLFGAIQLKSPPSYRPANQSAGNLEIDPQNILEDLAVQLTGAKLRVRQAGQELTGTLMGLNAEEQSSGGQKFDVRSLVVLTAQGIRQIPLREISEFSFTEESVQAEIQKALQRKFQEIKPESTFVDLTVASEAATEATLQYTIPAAAWKITYRLREREDQSCEFQGFAIVDNNTDEDWNGFQLAVVTGEPITFSTDLAESKIPARKRVNVVRDQAFGAVEPEAGMPMSVESYLMESQDDGGAPALYSAAPPLAKRRMSRSAGEDWAERMRVAAPVEQAEVQTVGDFCLFEVTQPVSIAANRSAVIPVFCTELDDFKRILHYHAANHPTHAFRTLEFVNNTGHNLGRGVCTVYEQGSYAGSCLIPALATQSSAMLPHALETGVQFKQESQAYEETRTGLRISDGVFVQTLHCRQVTDYPLVNRKAEAFAVALDHDYRITNGDLRATLRVAGSETELPVDSKLDHGVRLRFNLEANATTQVRIEESRVRRSSVQLIRKNDFLLDALLQTQQEKNGPLVDDPGIKKCLQVQQELEAVQHRQQTQRDQIAKLEKRQERLRENIRTGGQNEQTAAWRKELGTTEDRITEIEETDLPKLLAEEDRVREKLREAILQLDVQWSQSGK